MIVSFGEGWTIDGTRLESFAGGLRDRQVETRHEGRAFGIHVDLVPPAARRLLGVPLDELAYRQVPLEELLGERALAAQLHEKTSWPERFRLLDEVLAARLRVAPPAPLEAAWAWGRLMASHGRVRIGALAQELGWSRKRLVARFRDEVGVPPKTAARILRFERARSLVVRTRRPDWARLALDCGYYDQSHLVNDFRAFTGRTPETFFQDAAGAAA